MPIQDSDYFLLDDAGTSKKITATNLKGGLNDTYGDMKLLVNLPDYTSRWVYCKDVQTNLPDDHWVLVERSDTSYKVNGSDFQDYFPSAPAGASGVIQDSHSPDTPSYGTTSSLIVNVTELRVKEESGVLQSGMLNMGVPQTNVQTLELSDDDNLDDWNIGDNLVMINAGTGEVISHNPQTSTITNVTATTKNWASFCSVTGGWEKPPSNIFDGREDTNGGGFSFSTLTFNPGTQGPTGTWLRGRFAGTFDVYVNNGSGGEILKYTIGARTGSRVYSEVEFDQEEQLMRLSGTNDDDYSAMYYLDIGNDTKAMRLVDGDYVEVKCENTNDLQGWRYGLLSQSRGGSDVDTRSFGVDLTQNMLIMDGGAFRGTDGSSVRTSDVTAAEATFVSLRNGGGGPYTGTGRYGGHTGNEIIINNSNKSWVVSPNSSGIQYAIKNTSLASRLRQRQRQAELYTDIDQGYELQLVDDTNLHLMREMDVTQNGAVITEVLKDSTPPTIKVEGGEWSGTDGSGTPGGASNVIAQCDLLTVESLPDINFADNESIRMVGTIGGTASYVPVTSTITNVNTFIPSQPTYVFTGGDGWGNNAAAEDNNIDTYAQNVMSNTGGTLSGTFANPIHVGGFYIAFSTRWDNSNSIIYTLKVDGTVIVDSLTCPQLEALGVTSKVVANANLNSQLALVDFTPIFRSAGIVEMSSFELICPQMGGQFWVYGGIFFSATPLDVNVPSSQLDQFWSIDNAESITLTFADPCPDLKFFQFGDLVQEDQYRRDYLPYTGGAWFSGSWADVLDGTDTNSASWKTSGGTAVPTLNLTSKEVAGTTFTLRYQVKDSNPGVKINGGDVSLINDNVIRDVDIDVSAEGGFKTFEITPGGGATGDTIRVFSLKMDGNYLIQDTDGDIKVIFRDPAARTMVVDGGAWTGDDGTNSGDVADRETEVTGPSKSGTAKCDGVPDNTTFRIKDSNGEWIDNTNRLGTNFYTFNNSTRVSFSRYLQSLNTRGLPFDPANVSVNEPFSLEGFSNLYFTETAAQNASATNQSVTRTVFGFNFYEGI